MRFRLKPPKLIHKLATFNQQSGIKQLDTKRLKP